ncbi:photosystem I reaction center subunit IX [Candidatus Synechococcus calcipolaris G9]|uniref:Photosystem I reaction center subunit IX n=1 Tax=Candidatus Synechococcus calcipolaris G9 TaxID=1497997 RepID=A0ABT6F176_9SYNE|nr:photosystem I reaction center subunit IX [Candidatus Synechococcus calcipolaris]MDG2991531.1 photosystem I reaction center subunit IX [Candidatus Synechococcus calcipolaris G9]
MQTKYLLTYLSTAPVITALWLGFTAGLLIEFNRFFPDLLFHPL